MIKRFLQLVLIAACVCAPEDACARQMLNGSDWTFGQARYGNRYPATVPGVVHTDLMANGIIDDPFDGLNERGVQWIDKEDWVYEKDFEVDPDILAKEHIELVFDGLDTYADVYLNDKPVLAADNMFRTWRADVRDFLHQGRNTIRVLFRSPIATDMPKWEKLPHQYRASNDQSENGGVLDRKLSVFARKAGYHYGWDWGPRLVTSGIWRDVYLDGWDGARILDVYVRQHDVSARKASVSNVVDIEADRDMKNVVVSVADKSTGKVLGRRVCDLSRGHNRVSVDFVVKNPRLWWCHNLGKPELYTFTTTVSCPGGPTLSQDERVGLRSVEIVTDPDADGTMQFYFVLNGVPVFAKGTNYIPQDNFLPRVTRERHMRTLQDAVAANMNMIRVWGGGIYEDDVFYDLCDELGLMVWQDFMFGCSMYPATGEWLESVKMEARDNLVRLRNHPAVVIWCGGNECLDAWYNWGWKRQHTAIDAGQADRMEREMNTQYFEALPEMVELYHPDAFYWANSPFSGRGKGSDGINGDRHYYGVWQRKFPVSQYNNEKSHFFSEYGVQSFPEYGTVLKYAPDTTAHRLDSDVMMWHQRGGENANGLIAWYLENEYRKPMDFRDMLYLNQVFQADAMRTAIEAHRRDMPHCMGSLLWQHDDCWPVASWSTRDYYGNWKAAHYLTRKAFENVIVSSIVEGDSIHVYVVSDMVNDIPGTLTATTYSIDGKKLWSKEMQLTVPANTSTRVWSGAVADVLAGADMRDAVVNLRIHAGDHDHDGNYFMCKQSELNLPVADIACDVVRDGDDGYVVEVTSAGGFVRAVYLSVDGEQEHFDDNYFDLLPGQSRRCSVRSRLEPEEFKTRLRVKSLSI